MSQDGRSWSKVASPGLEPVDVAWSGSTFAAVATSADNQTWAAMTSPDGLEWSVTTLPAGVSLRGGIAWGGSQWLGLGDGLLTSLDGVNWTTQVPGVSFRQGGWNGKEALALGTDGTGRSMAARSSDGSHWTVQAATPPDLPIDIGTRARRLATDGQKWLLATEREVMQSSDGVTWEATTVPATLEPDTVIWTGSRFIVAGFEGVATSPDGSSWDVQSAANLGAVAWAGDRFVAVGGEAVGGSGTAFTSSDGQSWTPATHPPEGPVVGLAWTGAELVAVGSHGGVYTSPDGDAWTRQVVPSSVAAKDLAAVAWNGSTIVAVGAETALVSAEGVSWSAVDVPGSHLRSVAWGAGRFVAVGESPNTVDTMPPIKSPVLLTSTDGLSWAPVVGYIPAGSWGSGLAGIAWSGTRFVAVGSYAQVALPVCGASGDGDSWSWDDTCPGMSGVFWTGFGFLTIGAELFTSIDGLSWVAGTRPDFLPQALADNGRQLVGVGLRGHVELMNCSGTPPMAQAGTFNKVVVTAASAPGLGGTNWVTDLELLNPTTVATPALLYYLPRGTDNTVAVRRAVTVPPGQAVRIPDVVGQRFGRSGSAGALVISSPEDLLVTSRTSTSSDSGSLGQYVPGQAEDAALVAGQEGRLIQLSEGAAYRTNVGLASVSAVPTSVTVTLYRGSGERVGALPVSLPPFGCAQVSKILQAVGVTSVDDAFAVVRSDTPGARYFAYASVVDNVSGDPLTVLPVLPSSSEPLYLPSVAHQGGLNGTLWRTDLQVHNPGAVTATFRLELLKNGQESTAAQALTFMLDPGTGHRYPDVVMEVFGFEGSGAIRITPMTGSVIATARTFTDTGSGSRGQFIPAVPLSAAVAPWTSAGLIQLTHTATPASGFRTNVGYVNATAAPITVKAELHKGDGTLLGSRLDTLAPYAFLQVNSIFATVTAADVPDGFAVISSPGADVRFFAYASVVDNVSGAPVYIPAQ